jgi:hypothetical protein
LSDQQDHMRKIPSATKRKLASNEATAGKGTGKPSPGQAKESTPGTATNVSSSAQVGSGGEKAGAQKKETGTGNSEGSK